MLRGRGFDFIVLRRCGFHISSRRCGGFVDCRSRSRSVNHNRSRSRSVNHNRSRSGCWCVDHNRCRIVCHDHIRTIQQVNDRPDDLHCRVAIVMVPVMVFGVCRCGSCHCEYCHCCQAADPFCFLCVRHNPISLIEGFCFRIASCGPFINNNASETELLYNQTNILQFFLI